MSRAAGTVAALAALVLLAACAPGGTDKSGSVELRLHFATVHYLSRGNADGTGFFRHRATGFETLDTERLPAYRAIRDAQMARLRDQGYPGAEHSLFEQIGAVEARCDRLILYRASLFHSELISALPACAADPVQGRLTGNLFLQCRKAA